MIRFCSCFLFLSILSLSISPAKAQTAKPDNPQKLNLELLIVTYRAEGTTNKDDAKLVAAVEEVVKKHESAALSTLQDAVNETLPKSSEKAAAEVDAFSLKTYHDLEQWVKFGSGNPRLLSPYYRGDAATRLLLGETEVKATPWVLDEERFGIGVTVQRHQPGSVLPQRNSSSAEMVMETVSFTSNTLLDENEAGVINSYRHQDNKLTLVMIVVARVSR
ncbi:hypothetical protein DTL42_05560 [Bremerella cremea]|uniref:Uncharacterized protein n=1 Tax=Bremerella cremea TaxID=1031537 RepID=A0A368KVZ6_9BACT|nr:hypothetical protein [Bremerella cremea]RCS54600.1 hypothetical protein DTL42_05560 [Bremerella cremea]